MKLAPREVEKLGLHNAGYLAQKRLARGLRLNYTEAVALIATQVRTLYAYICICMYVCVCLCVYRVSYRFAELGYKHANRCVIEREALQFGVFHTNLWFV